MKTTLELLTEGRSLVLKGHTKHKYARNTEGGHVLPHSEAAVCFCAAGAIIRAAEPPAEIVTYKQYSTSILLKCLTPEVEAAITALASKLPEEEARNSPLSPFEEALSRVAEFNDNHSQAEVVTLFDRVIASLQQA